MQNLNFIVKLTNCKRVTLIKENTSQWKKHLKSTIETLDNTLWHCPGDLIVEFEQVSNEHI